MTIQLGLIVIRSRQPDILASFYHLLGLDFVREKHGKGPEHYAAKLGEIVLEIYPMAKGSSVESGGRIGFNVSKLDELLMKLISAGVPIEEKAKQTQWGFRAVIRDPDGRAVELIQL